MSATEAERCQTCLGAGDLRIGSGDVECPDCGGTGKRPPKNVRHVVPVNDTMEHVTDGVCACAPRVERVADGVVIVHDAMDGRK